MKYTLRIDDKWSQRLEKIAGDNGVPHLIRQTLCKTFLLEENAMLIDEFSTTKFKHMRTRSLCDKNTMGRTIGTAILTKEGDDEFVILWPGRPNHDMFGFNDSWNRDTQVRIRKDIAGIVFNFYKYKSPGSSDIWKDKKEEISKDEMCLFDTNLDVEYNVFRIDGTNNLCLISRQNGSGFNGKQKTVVIDLPTLQMLFE